MRYETRYKKGDKIKNCWEVYRILHGGMGIVYVVYDHESREVFAAKTFQDEVFDLNPAIANRFTQEALAWINLDLHQNVTQARFAEKIEGKPYLFLEYVSGGDLSGWIGTPRLTENLRQVLRFAIQFCDGMTYTMSKGIKAHRDIKPQNCLITEDNTLKVTDFGLAKIFDDADLGQAGEPTLNVLGLRISLSRTGAAAGTCTHMAPEQFDNAKHVDMRADIYSFGVMLFQMITGKLPFIGRTWQDFERFHKTQQPPKLDTQNSALESLVVTCLAKDPTRRFASFDEVRKRLEDIYERLTGKPAPQPVIGIELDAADWNNKGGSLNKLGRYEEAIVCYKRAVTLTPQFEEALTGKGVASHELGRNEEALACYDRALTINPGNTMAWSNKGITLRALGRTYEAITCYEHALELNPYDEKAWSNKGVALRSLGRTEEAIACYDRALILNPRLDEAWYNKGVVFGATKRYEEAIIYYERALAINPYDAEAWDNKGAAFAELGRQEEALACFDSALAVNPHLVEVYMVYYNKGKALYALGRNEAAITCYDQCLAAKTDYAEAWFGKGNALYRMGRYQEAISCFESSLEINPNDAEAWFNKGVVLIKGYQSYHEALECLSEAQRLGYPPAAQVIRQLRQMLG